VRRLERAIASAGAVTRLGRPGIGRASGRAARFAFVAPATFRIAREIAATRVSAPSAPR
jgi:hypothetical protein